MRLDKSKTKNMKFQPAKARRERLFQDELMKVHTATNRMGHAPCINYTA